MKNRLLQWLWSLLPDECEVEGCCRKGMRGNENRIYPFPDDDLMQDFYIVMCDYCSSRFHHGEVLNVSGSIGRLICKPKGTVVDLARRRKIRRLQ